jgi:hypothetical protein
MELHTPVSLLRTVYKLPREFTTRILLLDLGRKDRLEVSIGAWGGRMTRKEWAWRPVGSLGLRVSTAMLAS